MQTFVRVVRKNITDLSHNTHKHCIKTVNVCSYIYRVALIIQGHSISIPEKCNNFRKQEYKNGINVSEKS